MFECFEKPFRLMVRNVTLLANIMNMFWFTLKDAILEWGENFMQSHLNCTFLELEVEICKQYQTIQNNEHVYMALKVIK